MAKQGNQLFADKFVEIEEDQQEELEDEAFEELRQELRKHHNGVKTREQIKYMVDE